MSASDNMMGIAAGGYVRVGLEDNIHYDRGRQDLADTPPPRGPRHTSRPRDGPEPATPVEARAIIGMSVA